MVALLMMAMALCMLPQAKKPSKTPQDESSSAQMGEFTFVYGQFSIVGN
jgi:hypothetical protein